MADPVNELLMEVGLTENDFDKPGHSGELETLRKEIDNIENNPVTMEKLQTYIRKMRLATLNELSSFENLGGSWLSLLSFLIPIIGIIRKWYQDQKRVKLEAQLKVCTTLEEMMMAPDKRREALLEKLKAIKDSKK